MKLCPLPTQAHVIAQHTYRFRILDQLGLAPVTQFGYMNSQILAMPTNRCQWQEQSSLVAVTKVKNQTWLAMTVNMLSKGFKI